MPVSVHVPALPRHFISAALDSACRTKIESQRKKRLALFSTRRTFASAWRKKVRRTRDKAESKRISSTHQQVRLHKSTKRICHNIFSQYFPSNYRFLGGSSLF
jgi:hypothetical protein